MPLVHDVVCVARFDQFLLDGWRFRQSNQADVCPKLLQHPAEGHEIRIVRQQQESVHELCRREMQSVAANLDINAFLAPLAPLAELVRHRFQPFLLRCGTRYFPPAESELEVSHQPRSVPTWKVEKLFDLGIALGEIKNRPFVSRSQAVRNHSLVKVRHEIQRLQFVTLKPSVFSL